MNTSYLENKTIIKYLNQASSYQKKQTTGLRLPSPIEIGQEFITYVKDDNSYRKESLSIINNSHIIARNSEIIGLKEDGQAIFNEWPISFDVVKNNYGEDILSKLTHNFTYHKKHASLKAIEITEDIFTVLNIKGNTLEIPVSWSHEPMIAYIGDYLTDQGYSISKNDMLAYSIVN